MLGYKPDLQIAPEFSNKFGGFYVKIMTGENATVVTAQTVNEAQLIEQAQNGNRNAFSELVRAHAQGVMNVTYRMCGDAHISEDAAQEAFIRACMALLSDVDSDPDKAKAKQAKREDG